MKSNCICCKQPAKQTTGLIIAGWSIRLDKTCDLKTKWTYQMPNRPLLVSYASDIYKYIYIYVRNM